MYLYLELPWSDAIETAKERDIILNQKLKQAQVAVDSVRADKNEVCTCICKNIYLCMYVCMRICMYVYIFIYMNAHIYIYICN
jgi:hypothetical protein